MDTSKEHQTYAPETKSTDGVELEKSRKEKQIYAGKRGKRITHGAYTRQKAYKKALEEAGKID